MFDTSTQPAGLDSVIQILEFADKNIATQNLIAVSNGCSQIESMKTALIKIDQKKHQKAIEHLDNALNQVAKRDLTGIHNELESAINLLKNNN